MKAEIISIGTELLLGDITDTNATFISAALRSIGIDLLYRTTVGDNEKRIAECLGVALGRVDFVMTSGGLGPTVDDVTREAIARATGCPLEFHEVLLKQIEERFRRFGTKMTDNNKRQAFAPQGAILIENPVGTAPIFILNTARGVVLTLPGVPREMKYLLEHNLLPWLAQHNDGTAVIESLTLRTAGIGESQVDSLISDMMTWNNPTVGLAAHPGQTDIRITAKAGSRSEVQAMIGPVELEIRKRVGKWIFGTDTDTVERVVAQRLQQGHHRVAITEIGTGNAVESRLQSAGAIGDLVIVRAEEFDSTGSDKSLQDLAASHARYLRQAKDVSIGLTCIVREELDNSTQIGIAVCGPENSLSRAYSWSTPRSDAAVWVSTHSLALLLQLINDV